MDKLFLPFKMRAATTLERSVNRDFVLFLPFKMRAATTKWFLFLCGKCCFYPSK